MMKVKLFTHTDLDGVGCAVVAENAFQDVDIEYVDYGEVNAVFNAFLDEHGEETEYDRVFMTDISIDRETAIRLNSLPVRFKFTLVDHHKTALWLNEYDWSHIRAEESNLYKGIEAREEVMSSGTSLFFKFLRDKHLPNVEFNKNLKAFVEVVRRYDSWEWNNVYKDDHPKKLNDLLYLIGRENFLERFMRHPLPTFTDTELTLLAVEEYRANKYIWKKKQEVEMLEVDVDGLTYNVAYVFAEQYSSLLGNAIAEELGDNADFVALIDVAYNKVSIRGIHDDLDLGKSVAKVLGEKHGKRGGGHPKACAFEFNDMLAEDLVQKIFPKEWKKLG
jgi:uncharacterized protein